jgi:hypothetical protein
MLNNSKLQPQHADAIGRSRNGMVRVAVKLPLVAVFLVSGCATIFDGTSQEITVNTNPAGASCVFTRNGTVIGTIANTPALLSVQKRKWDITIACGKPGYAQATFLNHSGTSAAIAGNVAADILLTAGLSSIVDSADGADNKSAFQNLRYKAFRQIREQANEVRA